MDQTCKRCLKTKPLASFRETNLRSSGDGRYRDTTCEDCRRSLRIPALLPVPRPSSGHCPVMALLVKRCTRCLREKVVTDFYLVAKTIRHRSLGAREATCAMCRHLLAALRRLLPPKPTTGFCPLLVAPKKRCSKCGKEKEINEENFRYRFQIIAGKPMAMSTCRVCDRDDALTHYRTKVTPEARRAHSLEYEHSESGKAARARSVAKLVDSGWMAQHGRRKNLRRNFGITLETVSEMLKSQDNRCAISRTELTKPYVDHDHQTGKIRGLLCMGCNSGIGYFHESVARIFAAITYLARPLPLIDRSRSYPVKGPSDEHLRGAYNITLDSFNNLLNRQGGVCAICHGESGSQKKRLSVDHVHGTKDIRGLLCGRCNVALGYFKDNPTAMASAIWYLHRARLEQAA